VFVLIRNDNEDLDYEDFMDHVTEINFFDPKDREGSDIEEIIIDAWNFMRLQEEEEERLAELRELDNYYNN